MSSTKIERWNRIYQTKQGFPEPNPRLTLYRSLLPARGKALDLASGLGADALYLAAAGFKTTAWDASSIAVDRLQTEASARGLALSSRCIEVQPEAFQPNQFDLIYVRHFLDRRLFPAILASLTPRGTLFYETFVQAEQSNADIPGPSNPHYRLAPNELLALCQGLKVHLFTEGYLADATGALRPCHEALLIGSKPG